MINMTVMNLWLSGIHTPLTLLDCIYSLNYSPFFSTWSYWTFYVQRTLFQFYQLWKHWFYLFTIFVLALISRQEKNDKNNDRLESRQTCHYFCHFSLVILIPFITDTYTASSVKAYPTNKTSCITAYVANALGRKLV